MKYPGQRLVHRNKLVFAAAAALIAGLGLSTWDFLREGQVRDKEREPHDNERRLLYVADMYLAQSAWDQNNFGQLGRLLEETQTFPDRGFEWYYWQRKAHPWLKTLRGHLHTEQWNSLASSQDSLPGIPYPHIIWPFRNAVNSVAFSLDGQRIVTGGGDHTAKVWDAVSGRELLTLKGHGGDILSVAFSPDGQRIVTGSSDRTATVWDAMSGRELLTLMGHSGGILSVAFSPDGQRIITGSDDGTAKVWDAASNQQPLTLKAYGVRSADFSPDGQRVFTVGWNEAKVSDTASGHKLLTFGGHAGSVSSVAFSPDGQRIVTGSDDWTAKVWETASGRELLTLEGHNDAVCSAVFSPDGRRIVTGSADHTAKVWDAVSGRELLTLKGHSQGILSVAFSPDGRRIVTVSHDGTAKVWEAARREQVLQWQEEEAALRPH